jgi:hypothetical protein
MKIYIIISALTFTLTTFAQKKKECGQKLDSMTNNLSGQWKLIYAEFSDSKGVLEQRKYPEHILVINKSMFNVKRQIDSIPYQTGKLRIKKDNPAKYGNCEVLLHFKSIKDKENPVYTWDLDTYHIFWLIEKCDKDSLVLYSPNTCDFIDKKCGVAYRHYARQK